MISIRLILQHILIVNHFDSHNVVGNTKKIEQFHSIQSLNLIENANHLERITQRKHLIMNTYVSSSALLPSFSIDNHMVSLGTKISGIKKRLTAISRRVGAAVFHTHYIESIMEFF